ncbi:MAG: lipopolysaccharide biosynthesis protein [Thiomonas sp.]
MQTRNESPMVTKSSKRGVLLRLFQHTSNYSIGSILVMLASIISFPILTRLFTVAEYGTMALVTSTILFMVGVGKLGLQHSVVRYYSEVEAGTRENTTRQFFSTVLFGMIGVGLVVTILSVVIVFFLPTAWLSNEQTKHLIIVASPLVFIRVVDSALYNMLRAQQKSGIYSTYFTVRKYLGLGLIFFVLFYVSRTLEGFFVSSILGELIAVSVIIVYYARQHVFGFREFNKPLFLSMLIFGLPLLASELSMLLLNMGGRYIINYQLGPEPLGAFSAAFNFSDYLQGVLTASFAQAVVPMYFRMWEQQGREKTIDFIQQALKYYLALALPILAGMAAVGPELLRLLASSKYAVSTELIVFIVGGMLVSGGTPIFSAGIYINKLTKVVMYSVLVAAAVNLVLTTVLVRPFGIEGAAFAALVSYVLYTALAAYYGRKVIQIRMPWIDFVKYSLFSILMYYIVISVHPSAAFYRLFLQILTGAIVYSILVIVFDAQIRNLLLRAVQSVRAKS